MHKAFSHITPRSKYEHKRAESCLLTNVLIFLAILLNLKGRVNAAGDVNNVRFRGDCTIMGMKIVAAYHQEGAFLVETTGARFEYIPGLLKIYQGLKDRRLLAALVIADHIKYDPVEITDDHVLFSSNDLNIGVYGDSTCIIAPGKDQRLSFRGNFVPEYEGRYNGELLLIDKLGGLEIYPQRYETGYLVDRIELGKKDWTVTYQVKAGNRIMLAAFPGRPFDWVESFRCNVLFTYGSRGLGQGNPYGQMPPDHAIAAWARQGFNILSVSFEGVYADVPRVPNPSPDGPYVIVNEKEFSRAVRVAHANGMRFSVYASLYYHYLKFRDPEKFFEEINALHRDYEIDGIYLDGMLSEDDRRRIDDKIANWEMIRRLRHLFGRDGSIIYHATNRGSPVAPVPNIETYCTATLVGEIDRWEDPRSQYFQYHVRKYGISNTVALWLPSHKPADFSYNDQIDAMLAINGRLPASGGVDVLTPPRTQSGRYEWSITPNPGYQEYLKRLAEIRKKYYQQKDSLN